ncbi:transcriptional regulator [Pseudomonas capeferrum]|nr:transcriptional regulator [Pseudomonas capeferrum]MBA1202290.1 transcriptional regulator [Pseudomonas capeferrum]
MDHALITQCFGQQIKKTALEPGPYPGTSGCAAEMTRQKVIAIEQGNLSVGMASYARVLAALDSELQVITAVMPTLEEVQGMFE